MKNFYCSNCGSRVFFENSICLRCASAIAFDLESSEMVVVDGIAANPDYRRCQNYIEHATCNWAIPDDSPEIYCPSCRLTEVIPNLNSTDNLRRWARIEEAKRRLVYNLDRLELRPQPKGANSSEGLSFRFLEDKPGAGSEESVKTGHDRGTVTLNIAEADDAERERRRTALGEPYRTLLGHLRHEVGHYYWDRLVAGRAEEEFRKLFGDERTDYAAALKQHYEMGPPADWAETRISAYASAHPWEDGAETWAHYLHMMDSLGTVCHSKVSIGRPREVDPEFNYEELDMRDFDSIVSHWPAVACMINSLNRSLGMPDAYPFVTAPAVVEKLRFVHELIVRR